MPESDYILGDGDDELRRLGLQHEIWRDETRALLVQAGFTQGHTLLDVGCGPGFTTFDLLAKVGPEGRVIAVDSSSTMIEVLNREMANRGLRNVTGICQNVENLDVGLGIDGAFVRWVLCFLENPDAVIRNVARILKPGGRIAVMDYFNYLAITVQPNSSLFDEVYKAVFQSFESAGGGLEVGRRVPGLMKSEGLKIESIEPICGVGRPGTKIWNWLTDFQKAYFPKLVERGFLSQEEHAEYNHFWTEISGSRMRFCSRHQ